AQVPCLGKGMMLEAVDHVLTSSPVSSGRMEVGVERGSAGCLSSAALPRPASVAARASLQSLLILKHRDALDLDHQAGHRQRGDADAGPCRILAGVVAILDRNEKLKVAHVGM